VTAYSSPERINGAVPIHKDDAFSFGTIMWELCTRSRVWKGLSSEQIEKRVLAGERPQIPNDCFVASIIQRCWSQNPAERPDFAQIYKELMVLSTTLNNVNQMGHLIEKSLLQQQMQQHQMQVTRDPSPSYSNLSTTGPPPDPYAATPYSECPDAAAASTRTAEEDVMDLLQHRPPVLWDRFAHLVSLARPAALPQCHTSLRLCRST